MSYFRANSSLLKAIAIICFFHVAVYGIAVVSDFAHRDDYIAMQFHSMNFDWIHSVYAMDGRLIAGFFNGLFFNEATTIDALNNIRLAGFVGGIFLSLTIYAMLRQAKLDQWVCLTGAVTGTMTCASVVFTGWTICFTYSYSAALNLAAGMILVKALHEKGRRILIFFLLSCICYVVGTLIYQGTSPIFLLPIYFSLLKENSHKQIIGRLIIGVGFFVLFSVFYYLVFKAYSGILFETNPRAGRILSEVNLPAMFANLNRLFWMTINLNVVTESWIIRVLTMIGCSFFVWFYSNGKMNALLLAGGLILMILAGFIPPLTSSNQMSDFRVFQSSQVITIIAVSIGWCYLLKGALGKLAVSTKVSIYLPISIVLVLISGVAAFNLNKGLIQTSQLEHQIFQDYFRKQFEEAPKSAVYILSSWHVPQLSGGLQTGEFGKVNSNNKINARWFIEYVLRETFPEGKRPQTENFKFTKSIPSEVEPGTVVINSGEILITE